MGEKRYAARGQTVYSDGHPAKICSCPSWSGDCASVSWARKNAQMIADAMNFALQHDVIGVNCRPQEPDAPTPPETDDE